VYDRAIVPLTGTRPAAWTITGRQSLLSLAARALGRAVRGSGVRVAAALRLLVRLALTVAGLGLLTAAAWWLAVPAGLACAGVSCLVLEWAVKRE
jgi:hypothetical protein